ncbi:MAG: hypothetical protein ACOCQ4_00670 [bacterium]
MSQDKKCLKCGGYGKISSCCHAPAFQNRCLKCNRFTRPILCEDCFSFGDTSDSTLKKRMEAIMKIVEGLRKPRALCKNNIKFWDKKEKMFLLPIRMYFDNNGIPYIITAYKEGTDYFDKNNWVEYKEKEIERLNILGDLKFIEIKPPKH